jgi:hypothetical protein
LPCEAGAPCAATMAIRAMLSRAGVAFSCRHLDKVRLILSSLLTG